MVTRGQEKYLDLDLRIQILPRISHLKLSIMSLDIYVHVCVRVHVRVCVCVHLYS